MPRFVRAYIRGFQGSNGESNLHIFAGQYIFDYLYPLYHAILVITPEFLAPSSNVYTLDHVFDAAASQMYYMGSPFTDTQYLEIGVYDRFGGFRIRTQASLAVAPFETCQLEPLANYWLPA